MIFLKKNAKNAMFIISIGVVFYTFYKSSKQDSYLKTNFNYTTGKAINYSFSGDYENLIKYFYIVKNSKYFGYTDRDYNMNSPLNKYFKVKYSIIKPEISEMYLINEITDSTKIVNAGFKYK